MRRVNDSSDDLRRAQFPYVLLAVVCGVGLLAWFGWSLTMGFMPIWTSDLTADWRMLVPLPLAVLAWYGIANVERIERHRRPPARTRRRAF